MHLTSKEILFEDNHLIVINKRAGIACQTDQKNPVSIMTVAGNYLCEKYRKPGRCYLALVQRLDKMTSGVMVLAKTSKATKRINQQFRDHRVTKRYLALLPKEPFPRGSLWIDYLVHDKKNYRSYCADIKTGKKAKLCYQMIQGKSASEPYSLVLIRTYTGRYHQIRAQFGRRGYPLVGDQKYKARKSKLSMELALHSFQLVFRHPINKQKMHFFSPLPHTWPKKMRKISEAGFSIHLLRD